MKKFPKLTKKEKKALKEFKKKIIQKFGKEILELKLFGSKARGDSKRYSDIDVLIVLKSLSKKREDFILGLTTKLLLKYGVDISPCIYSKKQISKYKRIPSIFLQIVEREAIPL